MKLMHGATSAGEALIVSNAMSEGLLYDSWRRTTKSEKGQESASWLLQHEYPWSLCEASSSEEIDG